MKKFRPVLLCTFLFVSVCVSCSQLGNNGNINITLSESEHDYKVLAHYPEENTKKVERYLTKKIGRKSNVSFRNTQIDAQLTLDDGTTFYMKNQPGNLIIKLNKDENSDASYKEIKALGEGLQPLLKQ